MYSYRIIKGVEVQDNILHMLPLRRGNGSGKLEQFESEGACLQAQTLAQAEEILNAARAEANEIIHQARLEGEQIRQEAYRQAQLEGERIKQEAYRGAFEQGRREGYREGMAKAEEEGAAIRAQAVDVLKQAEESRRQALESLEQEIVELAVEIAEKLVSAQLKMDPETVLNIAAESLRLVAGRPNVVLYVNPAELELVESRKEELKSLLPARTKLQVVADSSILPGGCKVETGQGQVDATMERRREELIRALYSR